MKMFFGVRKVCKADLEFLHETAYAVSENCQKAKIAKAIRNSSHTNANNTEVLASERRIT